MRMALIIVSATWACKPNGIKYSVEECEALECGGF